MGKQKVIFRDLGKMGYQSAWDYQESLLKENVLKKSVSNSSLTGTVPAGPMHYSLNENNEESQTTHYLLFVEHPPVYTLGKSGRIENLLMTERGMADHEIEFYNTNRGGDITFHGPQQLVVYPILDLERFSTDIGIYLRNLEEVVILTLKEYGIAGERSAGETGVWLDTRVAGQERKICAIGVRCSRWVTMHGFALNVNTDLRYFENIIPCGIENKKVTSMQKETGTELNFQQVKKCIKLNFEKVFNVTLDEDAGRNQVLGPGRE